MRASPRLCIAIASVMLGIASVLVASPSDGPLLYAWFRWGPMLVDQWFLPQGDAAMLALAVLVLTLQYAALFAVFAGVRPALMVLHHFLGTPRHRSGLERRR